MSSIDSSLRFDQHVGQIQSKRHGILATARASVSSILDTNTQVVRFGRGIEFEQNGKSAKADSSAVILPCILGSRLAGPVLLATGATPVKVPFADEIALRSYYESLESVVVIIGDEMTDNARNLAPSHRINALFIVQLQAEKPKSPSQVLSLLDSANINAVTALAGPQSLVVVQIAERYYFYRGLANRTYLDTAELAFGADVTEQLGGTGMRCMIDPRVKRFINLDEANAVLFPRTGRWAQARDLKSLLEQMTVDDIASMGQDITAIVPQLQVLLNDKDLQHLSESLVFALSEKINNETAELRQAYVEFRTKTYKTEDLELTKKRDIMLGELKKRNKEIQKAVGPAISSLANMMSAQATSKRTHDLKRLERRARIKGNVEAAKAMNYETLAGYLETHASDMGVLLLNIKSSPYEQLLRRLNSDTIDAR